MGAGVVSLEAGNSFASIRGIEMTLADATLHNHSPIPLVIYKSVDGFVVIRVAFHITPPPHYVF